MFEGTVINILKSQVSQNVTLCQPVNNDRHCKGVVTPSSSFRSSRNGSSSTPQRKYRISWSESFQLHLPWGFTTKTLIIQLSCSNHSTYTVLLNTYTEWPKKMYTLLQEFGGFDSVWMPMVATSNTHIESKIQGHLSYQFCFCINNSSYDYRVIFFMSKCVYIFLDHSVYTGCPRRNVPDFGRVFLMLKYTDITQNTYVQSWTVTEIMAREVSNFDSCYSLIDYQIHIETVRNMWFM